MKDLQKWIYTAIMVIPPLLIFTVLLFLSELSIKEFPLWTIIVMSTLFLVPPFIFLFVQRTKKRVKDLSQQKKKKRILIVWSVYTILTTIFLIIIYFINFQSFLCALIFQAIFLPSVFFLNFRLFFPTTKESSDE